MDVAKIIAGLVALGAVALVTLRSLRRPQSISRLLHDLPVFVMYVLGGWLLAPLGWPWVAGYAALVAAGSVWFMATVCPHCRSHGQADGPSLYCIMAARVAKKGDATRFVKSFRRNTAAVAAGWVVPPVGGIVVCLRSWGEAWALAGNLVLLVAFSLIAFWLVPVGARPGCGRCGNKGECPHANRLQAHR